MRADRLLQLLMLLQRHRRATAKWLAEQLEVSERTILRDMEALSAAGVPVYTEQGRGGGCVLMDDFTTRASGLTPGEAQALFAWASRESSAELGLGRELSSALAKIAATAPPTALEQAEALGDVVIADRRRWFAEAERVPWLPVLREASSRQRRLRVRYGIASDANERMIDPVGLVDHSGRWYLVAESEGEPRTFRVSRFLEVNVTDDPVQRADPRSLAELWPALRAGFEAGRAVDLVVEVHADAAETARRLLTLQLAAGASIEVSEGDPEVWRLRIRQPGPVIGMAVITAPGVTVRTPVWLVDEIRAACERALDHYGTT